jgi:cytochrome c oxidase subunit 3
VGAIALFMIAFGAASYVTDLANEESGFGFYLLVAGIALIIYMLAGWFKDVVNESLAGKYSHQMDNSFRQGMSWFIFSEVMFFAAFFGALLYMRVFSVPWLGGAGNNFETGAVLWPDFVAQWPLLTTPDGTTTSEMGWYGLPLLNTVLLLSSSVTAHYAHSALLKNNRSNLKLWLGLTIVLGLTFMYFQVQEYAHGYSEEMRLYLDSGVYGNSFYLLTGFHGMHVTLGCIMLIVMWFRVLKGHFTPEKHFAFQAASWYWHFVDVVWVMLFVFVYIL